MELRTYSLRHTGRSATFHGTWSPLANPIKLALGGADRDLIRECGGRLGTGFVLFRALMIPGENTCVEAC